MAEKDASAYLLLLAQEMRLLPSKTVFCSVDLAAISYIAFIIL
jgi:hypothetical protein